MTQPEQPQPAERADTAGDVVFDYLESIRVQARDMLARDHTSGAAAVLLGLVGNAIRQRTAERQRAEQAALVNKHLDNALVEADQRAERYRAALDVFHEEAHRAWHTSGWQPLDICPHEPCKLARKLFRFLTATPVPAAPACAQHGAVLDTDPDGTTRCSACGQPSDGREE